MQINFRSTTPPKTQLETITVGIGGTCPDIACLEHIHRVSSVVVEIAEERQLCKDIVGVVPFGKEVTYVGDFARMIVANWNNI